MYKRIEKFNINSGEFALVKNIAGSYGLINKEGKEVVKTIYENIADFGKIEKGLALVKSITGTYGFIDKNGNEVVPVVYTLNEAKEQVKSLPQK